MENKKQLIIIPPMSEALKKLNEVLEGIAEDENVEITLIDDLKELSQFVATTGQCLILVSNAKKCATFLQENKAIIAKSYSKTILFTPKEIPNKTLIKFTKIGLTESILENSPPKTFLYKVKLQLRSIKTIKPQDDADKLVKSLDMNKTQMEEETGHEVKEKNSVEENVIEMGDGKKKRDDDSGEVIDYLNPLKDKVKSQENSIDTNWKSDRKKHLDLEITEEDKMTAESDLNSIDMYYRGKNKKNETDIVPEDDDFGKLKKIKLMDLLEEENKKSSFADIINEGSIKLKRPSQTLDEVEVEEKKASTDLDISEGSLKNKKRINDDESELDLRNARGLKEESFQEDHQTKDKDSEDLGGYLKGKITKIVTQEEDATAKIEKEYDNSEIEKNKRNENIDLSLIESDKKDKHHDQEDAPLDNVHDGEVDKIDGNMIGDSGTVDKIRTRMNGLSKEKEKDIGDEDGELDLFSRKKTSNEEKNDNGEQSRSSLELEKKEKQYKNEETNKNDDEDIQTESSLVELDLLTSDKKAQSSATDGPDERGRQNQMSPEKLKKERTAESSADSEDEDLRLRTRHGLKNKLEKDGNQTHDGNVDKIDTFYRGGESKKKEQSWDNLTDKKNTVDLIAGQKRSGMSLVSEDNKDLGEMTIDYRKLKEEFDLISTGSNQTEIESIATKADSKLRNDDDEGSFRVIEIDPRSLDISIDIINLIYNKEKKPKDIFSMITNELVDIYHGYPIFYNYKLSEKKFTEVFNSFIEINGNRMPQDRKDWWNEYKKEINLFEHFQTKSMTTWRCPEIVKNDEVWEDVELPTWADQELKNKYVELIFPYFDGLDRMGLAIIVFPDGIDPKSANGLLTVLEMARTLFLDTIQRYQVTPVKEREEPSIPKENVSEKKNVLSFFSGLFGKKKAG